MHLIVILILGGIIGVLAVRGAKGMAYGLTVAVGVIGAWAVVIRPEPTLAKMLPTLIGTAVSLGVLGGWRHAAGPAEARQADDDRPRLAASSSRERSASDRSPRSPAGSAGRFGAASRSTRSAPNSCCPRSRPTRPRRPLSASFSLGVEGIEPFVVPNDRFYRIDTALVVPQVAVDSWKLSIDGLVDKPMELTFQDLLDRPQIERHITLSCVSNPVGGDLVGNALWQGVRLADILDEAGLQDGAEQVVSRSIDGWTCGSPIEAIMDGRDAMLAIAMNGEPLPADHGYPVRIVVPGLFGYVSATKWVTDIRLTRWEDFDAYWVPPRLVEARSGQDDGAHRHTTLGCEAGRRRGDRRRGVGGAPRRVEAVEIRIDEGDWQAAELGSVPSADTWVQWVYRWDTSGVERGGHTVEVRAIDGDGDAQPDEPKAVAPDGAQGYHRISLDIA